MGKTEIRDVEESDFTAIQAIYGHHVRHGTGSFEETPPNASEMIRRWREVGAAGLPYVVCTIDGVVAGFAYAGPYRTRPAYRFSVEDSVYVAPDRQHQGIGRRLLAPLVQHCEALGYRQMVAVIGDRRNDGSIALHAAFGFREVGCLHAIGYKHGRWIDVVLMQRALGAGDRTLPAA